MCVDLTFEDAMKEVEAFTGVRRIPVFEGTARRGVVSVAYPEICTHGDVIGEEQPQISIWANLRCAVWFSCGCTFVGHFDKAVPA